MTRHLQPAEQSALPAASYRAMVERSSDLMVVIDAEGVTRYSSPAVRTILGREPEEMVASVDLMHPDDRAAMIENWTLASTRPGPAPVLELRMRHADGTWRYLESVGMNLLDDPEVNAFIVNIRDVTARKLVEEELRHSEERYRLLCENLPEAVLVHRAGVLQWANQAAVQLHGASSLDELVGRAMVDFVDPAHREAVAERLNKPENSKPVLLEQRIIRPDGTSVPTESVAMDIVYRGEPARLVVVRDLTERKRAEEALTHAALHDHLTGLPNRALLLDRLDRSLARAAREGTTVAVLFLDIDRFKLVNDSLGHNSGDELLVVVARRLEHILRPTDTVGRFGGDEFVVVSEVAGGAPQAIGLTERLGAVISSPVEIGGEELVVTASIGVALAPGGHGLPDQLLREADAAMYRAKSARTGYELFDEHMRDAVHGRLQFERELRHGLERGEFAVHYQPVVSLLDRRARGVEALARWHHPTRGLVEPNDFIPIAEETGLITALGSWVLGQACRQSLQWREELPHPIEIAVNLSAAQLHAEGLAESVAGILAEYQLEANQLSLCFEITESVVMQDPERVTHTLERLKKMGLRLSIDDFGTGYSSLAYLKRFPVDTLKIDQCFVAGLGTDSNDEAIVSAVINLAGVLGLEAVAEGVETAEQADRLVALGCSLAQGFYFARPQPAEALTPLLGQPFPSAA